MFYKLTLTQAQSTGQPTSSYTAHLADNCSDGWWQIFRLAYRSTPNSEGKKLP